MLQPERRTYRKSPGRQYTYDYDPLRSRPHSANTGDARMSSQQPTNRGSHHTSGILAPRPDPRRTRQLLRQNILASKARSTMVLEPEEITPYSPVLPTPLSGARRTRRLAELERESEEALVEWEPEDIDPDLGYEYEYEYEEEAPLARPVVQAPVPRRASQPTRSDRRSVTPVYDDDYDEQDDYDDDEPKRKPRRKKKGVTRRKLLWGLGLAAVGGGTIAAIELGPKLPQAVESASNNLEKQLEASFQRGLQAGEEQVRKEFITALDSMEGVSLDAAIAAARLTRVAYDVFVSPLVTLAATVTGDFLNITLRALQTARSWLALIHQDNDTMQALQTVLETWVKQVNSMPKQIQAITDTDLDGAQSYLRALQHKLQQEQALLNKSTATPTPTSGAKPTATPKKP